MLLRAALAVLIVLNSGCARNLRPDETETAPRREHIFLMPVEKALAEARKLLAGHGFQLMNTEDPHLLLTEWKIPAGSKAGEWQATVDYERYAVVGMQVAPRQAVVRIFRISRSVFSNDAELPQGGSGVPRLIHMYMRSVEQKFEQMGRPQPLSRGGAAPWATLDGVLKGVRDLEYERELLLRLESRPSLETLTGGVKLVSTGASVRDESSYLQRWTQAPAPCGRKVQGFGALVRPGLTLLVGEQLGTQEVPAAVGDMVCEAAEAGLAVTLGLSISHTEQRRIEQYLASAGAPEDQDALLSGDFWRKPLQDGRGSRDVLDLIDRVRALRAAGRAVSVVAFDTDVARGSERDAHMARLLLQRRAEQPGEVMLVVAGNVHTRLTRGASWDKKFVSLSSHLREVDPEVKVLEVGYAQGRRWGCDLELDGSLDCNVMGATPHPKMAAAAGQPPALRMLAELDEDGGFHGFLDVGALSASPPAVGLPRSEVSAGLYPQSPK